MWVEELEIAFPPKRVIDYVDNYFGVAKKERLIPAQISRNQLLDWCEGRGIRPPLLFPETPPALPNSAGSDLSPKAAGSLYAMLAAALVLNYGKDALRDRETLLTEWLRDLENKGIRLPIIDKRTLLNHIEKAALKVESLYPE